MGYNIQLNSMDLIYIYLFIYIIIYYFQCNINSIVYVFYISIEGYMFLLVL